MELIRYIIFHPFQCVLKQAQVVYQLQKQSADVDDDDELDMDELDELEASLSKTSIQIKELGAET